MDKEPPDTMRFVMLVQNTKKPWHFYTIRMSAKKIDEFWEWYKKTIKGRP